MEHAASYAKMTPWRLLIPAFLIMALTISSCSATGKDQSVTVAALQTEFDSDLPKGTPMSVVDGYLTRKGFGSSGEIDNAKMTHIGKDPSTYELKTIVRNVSRSFFVTTDMSITFTFGRDKLLKSIEVKEVHTGP
jgi:hypothetical protein